MLWYLSHKGQRIGPLDVQQARSRASADPSGHAWREGFADWRSIFELSELTGRSAPMPASAPPPAVRTQSADKANDAIFSQEIRGFTARRQPG
jgi:hypothetical protein